MRAYNAREGLTRDQDTLPKKLFKKALEGGRSDGIIIENEEFQIGLALYYEQAGWDAVTGAPTRATLEDVGLGWAADDLGI
jgi:aldehyde:ferredoxin oxidoreductase